MIDVNELNFLESVTVSVSDAARYLNMSPETLRRRMQTGELNIGTAVRRGKKTVYIINAKMLIKTKRSRKK